MGVDNARLVLVDYFVAEQSTVVFGLDPAGAVPKWVEVPIGRQELRVLAARYMATGRLPSGLTSEVLQANLEPRVSPIADWAEADDVVYLAPHDALHYLPLHAVTIGADGPLGERNPVAYIPSATVLRHCLERRRPVPRSALLLADSLATAPVPFSRSQVEEIAEIFERAEVLQGGSATSANLWDQLAARDVGALHIAVHGVFDSRSPLRSGIELADGRLTASDLSERRLNVALVTLSACESGVSEWAPGDELLGLTRALISAGTPSVIVTQWPVEDLSASIFMREFYEAYLRRSEPKAVALRSARQRVRATTARAALAHAQEVRERLRGDRRAEELVRLAEGEILLAARDWATARVIFDELRADESARPQTRRRARLLAAQAGFGAETGENADETTLIYDSVLHWAPYILIGDWL